MSNPQILVELRRAHLLEGIAEEHLKHLAEIARSVELDAGTVVFREGDPAENVYLIISGRVSLEMCAPGVGCKRVLTVHDGELLAWSPVLDNEQLTATARTLEPTRLIEIDGRDIRAMCEEHPRLGYEFMRCAALALGKRLNAARLQLLDLYGDDQSKSHTTGEMGGAS